MSFLSILLVRASPPRNFWVVEEPEYGESSSILSNIEGEHLDDMRQLKLETMANNPPVMTLSTPVAIYLSAFRPWNPSPVPVFSAGELDEEKKALGVRGHLDEKPDTSVPEISRFHRLGSSDPKNDFYVSGYNLSRRGVISKNETDSNQGRSFAINVTDTILSVRQTEDHNRGSIILDERASLNGLSLTAPGIEAADHMEAKTTLDYIDIDSSENEIDIGDYVNDTNGNIIGVEGNFSSRNPEVIRLKTPSPPAFLQMLSYVLTYASWLFFGILRYIGL
ncbi:hypothetical protein SK128_017404, partial [Halocaridina rubra]